MFLQIIVLFYSLSLANGEPDFNFNEDSQFCCSDVQTPTETSMNYQAEKESIHNSGEKNFDKRLQLYKREIEGSGEEDYDQYDYDDDITETATDIPSFTTHAHRHHHGIAKTAEILTDNTNLMSNENNIKNDQSNILPIDEDIVKSVSKLESDISKTIENTKNIKDTSTGLNIEKKTNKNSNSNAINSFIHDSYDENQKNNSFINDSQIKDSKINEDFSLDLLKNSDNKTIANSTVKGEKLDRQILVTPITPLQNLQKETNITMNGNTSIIFNVDQHEDAEETLRTELDASTLMMVTTEQYSTSEDVNKTQSTNTRAESTTILGTFSNIEYEEPKFNNSPPVLKNRLKKYTSVSGKLFRYILPLETFYDNEDNYNMKLTLLDKNEESLKPRSWIQFNADKREIYGLPMEDSVSRWQFKLRATDSGNESIIELLEMFVYQHKGLRSVNHEINIQLEVLDKNMKNIDWQITLIEGIANILDNKNTSNIVVREVVGNQENPQLYNFTYFNESLPTGNCPQEELNSILKHLDSQKIGNFLLPYLRIKSVISKFIGSCQKQQTVSVVKNYPPVPRNQVDRVNATVGHLLIYKVPDDTFYDPNDNINLKLSLLTTERKEISQRHWLRFDTKNKEFYGIPKSIDVGSEEFLLVAEDSDGLSATDALIVVVNHAPKRDYSVYFKAYLAIRHDQFNVILQRKFMERLSTLFGDDRTDFIQIRSITTHHDSDGTIVNFYNTTLYKTQNSCPEERIESVRNIYFVQNFLLCDKVKKALGVELNLTNLQIIPLGSCHPIVDIIHRDTPTKSEQPDSISIFTDDYIFSFVIPAVIMLIMILLVAIIACFLHRRRITGKMELGDEEERKSFRPKGIPVIFQDELDEKPEIGNKSPIILKDEKPPLLPPSYNQSNFDGENEVDEYVPPPAVIVGTREIRGKSPATPSYRKPPPYVSP